MKKFCGFLACLVIICLSMSCSWLMTGNSMYYYQQQNEEEFLPPPPPPDEEESETSPLPEGAILYTMFDALMPNGVIDEELFVKFPSDVQTVIRDTLSVITTKPVTANFQNKLIKINIIDNYIPSVSYIDGTWDGSDSDYEKPSSDFTVTEPMEVTSTEVMTYMYKGYNPMYAKDNAVNTATYGDASETYMNRFMFYRFTANASIATVDTHLVAVDTYTSLIFAHSYPSAFDNLGNPTAWSSVGTKFYEKDPIGYVDDSGNFTMHSWYTDSLSSKKGKVSWQDVQVTGKSPYAYIYSSAGAILQAGTYKGTVENAGDVHIELKNDGVISITFPNEEPRGGTWEGSVLTIGEEELTVTDVTSNSFTLDVSAIKPELGIITFKAEEEIIMPLTVGTYTSTIASGDIQAEVKTDKTFSITFPNEEPLSGTWEGDTVTLGENSIKATDVTDKSFTLDVSAIKPEIATLVFTKYEVELPPEDVELHAGVYAGTVEKIGNLEAELKEDRTFSLVVPGEQPLNVSGTWGGNTLTVSAPELTLNASNISITSFMLDLSELNMGTPTFRMVDALQAGVYKGNVGGSIGELQAELTKSGTFSLIVDGMDIDGLWSPTTIEVPDLVTFDASSSTLTDITQESFTLDLTIIGIPGMGITTFTMVGEGGGDIEPPPPPPPTTYTVTYNVDGGSGVAPTQEAFEEGETFTVGSYSGTKEGYTFVGWSDGVSTYQPGQSYTMPASAVTFTASWEQDAVPEGATVYTMFDVLKPNGEIDDVILAKFPQGVQDAVNETLADIQTKPVTVDFQNKVIAISIIDNYVPNVSYVDGTWDGSGTDYTKGGKGFNVNAPTSVDTSNVKYYMYKGYNPMYAKDNTANTATYGDAGETYMNRFMFYRFTADAIFGVKINTHLVAVDTYTKLIFAHAYPSSFDSFGNPTAWSPVGERFFERDPVGYVDDVEAFVMHSWYTDALSSKEGKVTFKDVQSTGKSPYAYTFLEAGESANTYLGSFKGKTYKYRGEVGASEILEIYTFNETGMEITQTNTTWGSDTETKAGTFAFGSAISETEGTFNAGEKPFKLVVNGDGTLTLTIDDVSRTLVLAENYTDVEPYFIDKVKGKSYTYRSDSAGNSEILFVHEFSNDGRKLTKREVMWRGLEAPGESTFDYDKNASRETATYGGTAYTLSDGNLLSSNKIVGQSNFSDKGPLFLDRVKGQTFGGSGWTYIFTDDGKSITVKGKNWAGTQVNHTYTHGGDGGSGGDADGHIIGHTTASYKNEDGLSPNYYGVRLYTEKGIQDDTIRWTGSAWSSDSTTPTENADKSPATIDAEPGESVFYFNLNVTAKSIENVGMKSRRREGLLKDWYDVDAAYLTYAIRAAVFDKASAPSYDIIAEKEEAAIKPDGLIENKTITVGIRSTYAIEGDKDIDYILTNLTLMNARLALDSKMVAQGATKSFVGVFVETTTDNYRVFNDYGNPNVVFKYDEAQEGFVVDTENSNLTNTTVTENFVLKLDESAKDFTITYNNVSKVTYTLHFTM